MAANLLTDSTTETKLGAEVLAELAANLWPVDCQTCGRPFSRWAKPALSVQAVADRADASLHHRGCRLPGWRDYEPGAESEIVAFPHVTWRAGLVLLSEGVPVFLANPYYELATLTKTDGRWLVSTLDRFAEVGMGPDLFDGVFAQPSLVVEIDDDRVTAHVTDGAGVAHTWTVSQVSPDVRQALDTREWMTVGVTTSLDVGKRLRDNPMPALIAASHVRMAAARTRYTQGAQRLRRADLASKWRAELIGTYSEAVERWLGVTVSDDLSMAAFACSIGDDTAIPALHGREKLAATLLVALLYSVPSRTASGEPTAGGGVHVMAADAGAVDECFEMFSTMGEHTRNIVVRLAAEPTAEQRDTEYLADIVIGTPEQFRAAYAFYRDDHGDWSLHETRGQLTLPIGEAVLDRAGALAQRYPRLSVV
jgi:hypothetical protein